MDILKYFIILFALAGSALASDALNPKKTLAITLQQAEALAIGNNFDAQSYSLKKQILSRSIKESWREFLPKVGVSYTNNESVIQRELDTRSHNLSVNVSQLVYDGGRANLALKLSKLNLRLSKFEYDKLVFDIRLQVREAYYNLLKMRENILISEKSAERSRLQLKLIQKEYQLGTATKVDMLEVDSRLQQVLIELGKVKRDYFSKIIEFQILLGISRNVDIELMTDPLTHFEVFPVKQSLPTLFQISMRKRPDVYQIKINRLKSSAEYEIASSFMIPQVSLTSSFSLSGDRFLPREKGWSIGLVVSSNLYGSTVNQETSYNETRNFFGKGYNNRSTVNVLDDISYLRKKWEAGLNLKKNQFDMKRLKDTVFLEIKQYYDQLISDYEIMQLAEKRTALIWERLKIETKKAQLGELKRIDLMETEIEYIKAAFEHVGAKTDYMISAAKLENAMGVNPDFLGCIRIKRVEK